MTGFGRCEVMEGERKFTVEMKGVNHRYLDVNIRMPKKLNFFETAIRSLLKQSIQRGKVDIFISYEDFTENQMSLKYNESLAQEYMDCFGRMKEQFSLTMKTLFHFRQTRGILIRSSRVTHCFRIFLSMKTLHSLCALRRKTKL